MPTPFDAQFPSTLNEIILSYLHPDELNEEPPSSTDTAKPLHFQFFISRPAKKIQAQNWLLLKNNLKTHLALIPKDTSKADDKNMDGTHISTDAKEHTQPRNPSQTDSNQETHDKNILTDKENYQQLLSIHANGTDSTLGKLINDFYKKTIDDNTLSTKPSNQEFIKKSIYYCCQADLRSAGNLLLELLTLYGNHQIELSISFIRYGVIRGFDDGKILHLAINKKLPLIFFEELLQHNIKYPDSTDYIYSNCMPLRWSPLCRATLERNQIALNFLVANFPSKVHEMEYLKLHHDKFDNNYDFPNCPIYTLSADQLMAAKHMFTQALINSYSQPNKVTTENQCNALLILENQLENITSPEPCYTLYLKFMALEYQNEDLKGRIIERLQTKVCELFLSSQFVANFGNLFDYHHYCKIALSQPLFSLKHQHLWLNDKHYKIVQSRLAEAAELLEPTETPITLKLK